MSEFLHDAEFRTESWKRRHSPEAIARLGAWRWKGIQKHAGRILDALNVKRAVDFGGKDGPIGCGAVVVDLGDEWPEWATDGNVDCVFTSHTLEHIAGIAELTSCLASWFRLLSVDGRLIVHVPSYTCERWQPRFYDNPNQSTQHYHCFCVFGDNASFAIDRLIANAGFDIELAEHCGDDSIIVFARKPL